MRIDRIVYLLFVQERLAALLAATASEVVVMAAVCALYDRRMRHSNTASNLLSHVTSQS